mgnify:CR=1 FL=1|tara:strand:+ start:523 stop:762 length:240 start_codon:yes stop_codon:yes gene_type:complete
MTKFKVGDLVNYRPSNSNLYADGTKQLGVVIEVLVDKTPLYINFPEKEHFECEYKVIWINTGYKSVLLGFNLEKIEISS